MKPLKIVDLNNNPIPIKMKRILYFIPSVLLIACSGEAETTEKTTNTTSADTVAEEIVIPEYSEELLEMFAKSQSNDSTLEELDSNYIAALDIEAEESFLSADEVNMLKATLLNNRNTGGNSYQIDDFMRFDSLKQAGKYEEYRNSLDIGMMARADAAAVQLVTIDDSTDIFLWLIDYSTYEACPYAAGTTIYGSLFVNREFRNTALLGDESGGGDPPVWGRTLITAVISSEEIKIYELQEWGDEEYNEEDESYTDITTKEEYQHVLKIVDGYLVETESDYSSSY